FYSTRGAAFFFLDEPRLAIYDYSVILERHPRDTKALVQRALAHYSLREFDMAKEDLALAVKIDDQTEEAWYQRALIDVQEGAYERAVKHANRAIRINPRRGQYYFTRGLARLYLDREAQARADFDQAMLKNPSLKIQIERVVSEQEAMLRDE
ncbi:MAG: tetratricopeptide repeat protein, partial [Bacteroidota bacterium]